MKLEEQFEITDYNHSGLSCNISTKPHLIDKPISGLLKVLKDSGVKIDEKDSQVRHARGELPLSTYLNIKPGTESDLNVTGYCLKSENLEVALNYCRESDAPKRMDAFTRIGPSHIESSLKCRIVFIGEYEEGKIIAKIREGINNFYGDIPVFSKKDIKKFKKALKEAKKKGIESPFLKVK